MKRSLILSLILTIPASGQNASANDIVKFLRALSGPSQPVAVHGPRGAVHADHHHGVPVQTVGRVDRHAHYGHGVPVAPLPTVNRRPGLSFNISFGSAPSRVALAQPALPVVPVIPAPVSVPAVHRIGEIVTCPVPLETCVVVKDACEMAPGAIPVAVAVRDPHLPAVGTRGCVERVVYVQVYVPQCPLKRCRVSPCGTKVRLDFGQYEVDLTTRNNLIEIDYDN
ncbi:MAG: hypothetical protein R3C49_06515 [Planctomycetaceae bacterium]